MTRYCSTHENGLLLVLSAVSPVYKFNIGVSLHQHEAAPVLQQGCQGGVGDTTLDGAVAAIVPSCVQMFGDRPGGTQLFM